MVHCRLPDKSERQWARDICAATNDEQMRAWAASIVFYDVMGSRRVAADAVPGPIRTMMDLYRFDEEQSDGELCRVLQQIGYPAQFAIERTRKKVTEQFFETRSSSRRGQNRNQAIRKVNRGRNDAGGVFAFSGPAL